ncbi:hypothetical protein INT47_006887 [Mucor saturninus]|uniref:MULE transposase domain-containing protein n=1 Tax=Mucor saturninus TaxID=64648 RepID=A0A8H7V6L0_9FUNG|nr:hypothetical protein INT47_006887 [Mucor saturninus]
MVKIIATSRILMFLRNDTSHAGKPIAQRQPTISEVKRRKTKKPSVRVDCKAKITVTLHASGPVTISHHWAHHNHDPTQVDDILLSGLPVAVRAWIEKHVDLHMDWRAIKALLRANDDEMDRLDDESYKNAIPASLMVKYQDVFNIINAKLNRLSRKDPLDKLSVKKWMEYLETVKGSSTLFYNEERAVEEPFLVYWVAKWQKEVTIYKEVTPVLVQWLSWLKNSFSLRVRRIMIDCSPTEISAIRETSGSDVQIFLCHWHIQRAWELNVKKHVKNVQGTADTEQLRRRVHAGLSDMMHAEDENSFNDRYNRFKNNFSSDCLTFVAYFDQYWFEKREIWSKAWRSDTSFHTNNLIASFHNRLKSFYLVKEQTITKKKNEPKTQYNDYTDKDKARFFILIYDHGMNPNQAWKAHGHISRSTAYRWYAEDQRKVHKEIEDDEEPSVKKAGRPKILNENHMKHLKQEFQDNPSV